MSKKMFDEYIIAPGETILEMLETNSMTQLDLAYKTGINKKTINEIVKGKAPITVATALKLEYVFDIKANFWCNLESSYREKLERKKDFESIINEEKYLNDIPYLEMSKRKWDFIEPTNDSYERVINLRKFFAVASLEFDTELKRKLAFRKSANKNFSFESLYCFLRYGEIQSNKEVYNKFDIDELKKASLEIRKLANNSFLSQFEKIKKILLQCGVYLVYETNLPHTYINGVSYKITPDKAIIMISNKGKKDDILWFTFFHEIAHLIKHSKKEVFIDSDNDIKNDIEYEADEYSRNILIPDNEYDDFVKTTKKYTANAICDFARKNNILPGIVVGRLQKNGIIKWNQFNNLIIRI
jgi:HTH-type transcriptional regulator/antitoxin HigA